MDNNNDQTNINRRRAIKVAGAVGGGAIITQWHKPMVQAVIIPAHAQTSPNALVMSGGGGGSGFDAG